MKEKRELEHLGERLRAERLTPSSRLINAIVGRLPERVQRRPRASLRFALAAGLAVALVSAVTAVGGVGYAKKQVTHAVVAVKSAAVGKAGPTLAKSAGKQYKGGPNVVNVRTTGKDCAGLILNGQNLDTVTVVTVGGVPVKIVEQSKNHITVQLPPGVSGKVVVSGPNGSSEYKKKIDGQKCD
jgi:hypothetical protein